MDNQKSNSSDPSSEIRKQFDFLPFPETDLEYSPKEDAGALFLHSLVTAYYCRDQTVIGTEGMTILDAGCGSGYKSLILAEANPGATIVGVDISEPSVKLARRRLKHHGFENIDFHTLALEDLPGLNQQFDYINCDETLYLLPDPLAGLKAMRSVLKPGGILRTNFHCRLQRHDYFRAQEAGTLLGLMKGHNQEQDISTFRTAMDALKTGVSLKESTWSDNYKTNDQAVLANHLLRGDKGLIIPDFLALLEAAGLEFIKMVDWPSWELKDLFKTPIRRLYFWQGNPNRNSSTCMSF